MIYYETRPNWPLGAKLLRKQRDGQMDKLKQTITIRLTNKQAKRRTERKSIL